jgi:hypothetical protein
MGNPVNRAMAMDNAARAALNSCLATSIEKPAEYGGMIYALKGQILAKPPITQGNPNTVDVGNHAPNCGCPPGSTPVAYYHTHPIASRAGMTGEYNTVSDEDMDVVTDNKLEVGYVGTLDGSLIKFGPSLSKPVVLPGKLKNTKG